VDERAARQWEAAVAAGRDWSAVPVVSVCGQRISAAWGSRVFGYGTVVPGLRRCGQCGWIVALQLGTLEQEIAWYTPDSAHRSRCEIAGVDPDLIARVFTAILADAPPGVNGEPGHRSALLAHAAQHAPAVVVGEDGASHGGGWVVRARSDQYCLVGQVVCMACTFTMGGWAGKSAGSVGAECVVGAPCSVLLALTSHYGLDIDAVENRWRASR